MSFFQKSDTTGNGEFQLGGGTLQPIPDDTRVLAVCEEAKNEMYNHSEYIKLKWRVSQPAEYANRVLFQKLQVYDAAKQEAHRKMLAAIATNAGGKLFTEMEKANEESPSDRSLTTLTNKPMVLLLGVWELEDKSKNGNWVKAVSPRKQNAVSAAVEKIKAVVAPARDEREDLDDVPF